MSWFRILSLSPGPARSLQLSPEFVLILSRPPIWPPGAWYVGEVLVILSIRPGGWKHKQSLNFRSIMTSIKCPLSPYVLPMRRLMLANQRPVYRLSLPLLLLLPCDCVDVCCWRRAVTRAPCLHLPRRTHQSEKNKVTNLLSQRMANMVYNCDIGDKSPTPTCLMFTPPSWYWRPSCKQTTPGSVCWQMAESWLHTWGWHDNFPISSYTLHSSLTPDMLLCLCLSEAQSINPISPHIACYHEPHKTKVYADRTKES